MFPSFPLPGNDAIRKHSLSALPMGGFDGSGADTHAVFGLHIHRRLQIKRMELSRMEKVVKVVVSSCSPLKV